MGQQEGVRDYIISPRKGGQHKCRNSPFFKTTQEEDPPKQNQSGQRVIPQSRSAKWGT